MTGPFTALRRLVHRFAPVAMLLLLLSLVVGGTHHHADGAHDVCVLCSVGQGSAITADTPAPAATPAERPQTLVASSEHAPLPFRLDVPRGRAPPTA